MICPVLLVTTKKKDILRRQKLSRLGLNKGPLLGGGGGGGGGGGKG